jgi:hypothetical protein
MITNRCILINKQELPDRLHEVYFRTGQTSSLDDLVLLMLYIGRSNA